MSAIFISHSSKDTAAAEELRRWLEEIGHSSIFLDFHPDAGIPTGRSWEQELYQQLDSCRAVILLCSADSMSSRWCFAELAHARAMGKHVFPLRIADCELFDELRDVQVLDATTDREEALARLRKDMVRAGLDPAEQLPEGRPPYPGLLAFEKDDAAIFFGREEELKQSLDLLNRLRRFPGKRLALMLGASGSGKSSLARAGVLPRLRRDPRSWLVLEPFRPLEDPCGELALVLAEAFERCGAPRRSAEIRATLERGSCQHAGDALNGLARELTVAAEARRATVLMVVDQLEELLINAGNERVARFLPLLAAALADDASPLVVLGTLRSDFLALLQKQATMGELPFASLSVGAMSREGYARIIQGPAQLTSLELDKELVEAMVEDAATEDALPLLAFTLRELYDNYVHDNRLALDDYRVKLGGLGAAIGRAAEAVIDARPLSAPEEEDLRSALLQMVRINRTGGYARRRARWQDLPESVHHLIERFVQAHLLVSSGDGEERWVEVAHEALFRAWRRLVSWLDEDQEFLLWQKRADAAADDWRRSERNRGALLHGPALVEAGRWLARRTELLGEELRAFIESSLAAQQRRLRIRRSLAVSALAVVALFVSLIMSAQLDTAKAQAGREQAAMAAQRAQLAHMEAVAMAQKARQLAAREEAACR